MLVNIDSDTITVNNFFGHHIKVISITMYGHNKLIPAFSLYEIYQYSDVILIKHLPKNSFKKIEEMLMYSKQRVYFNKTAIDRRIHDGSAAGTTGTAAKIPTTTMVIIL